MPCSLNLSRKNKMGTGKDKNINLIFFLTGIAILSYLVIDFGPVRLWVEVRKTGWWLLPITALWLLIYILNTVAWNIILGRQKTISFRKLLSLKISGFAINYLTPVVGLAGEPWKVMNIRKLIGIEKASASIILYNLMHVLSHFFFWVTAIFLVLFSIRPTSTTYVFLGLLLIVLVWVITVIYKWHRKGIVFSFMRFVKRLPFLKKSAEKVLGKQDTLQEIEDQVVAFYNTRRGSFYATLVSEYVARVIGSVEFYFIMKAIGLDIDMMHAIYISAASSLLANLFFFIPLQLGTREGSLYLIYDSLRLTPGIGVFVSIVTRIREFFWIFIGLVLIRVSNLKSENQG